MEHSIKVSVIVPVHNAENYLNEFMDSLLAQTLIDIQIICIDDCSSDKSYEILMNYKSNTNIEIIKNDFNLGAANTRNKGLERAKGEYIICVDCDDILHKDYLRNLYNTCKESDSDIAIGYVEYFSNNISHCKKRGYRYLNRSRISTYPILDEPNKLPDIFQIATSSPFDKLIRRKIINDNNISFQNIQCTNDLSFAYICLISARRIIFVDNAQYFYRTNNPNSITAKWNDQYTFLFLAMDKVYEYIDITGIKENLLQSFNFKILKYVYCNYVEQPESIKEDYINTYKNFYNKWNLEKYYNTHTVSTIENNMLFNIINNDFSKDYIDILFDAAGDNVVELIIQYKIKGKNVALWGAGKFGRSFVKNIENKNCEIACVIDSNEQKQGKEMGKIIVYSYEQVKHKIDLILVTSYAVYEDVKEQIGSKIPMINVVDLMEKAALKVY